MVLKITVKTLDSQNYQFEADDSWTVLEFKEYIKDTIKATPNEQRLIFCGRVLQDDKKLIDYDCNGKVVHLVRRPPPSLTNLDNVQNSSNLDEPEVRYFDDNNVLFSAMTLGSEANIQNVIRQMVTLQQAFVTRTLSDGTHITSTIEPMYMTDIDRHLHNASRLLRITANTINECMARIALLPPTTDRTGRANLEPTRRIITTASSHTDLQMNENPSVSNICPSATNNIQNDPVGTVDDININVPSSDSSSAQVGTSRQSLTTDDLPQSTTLNQRIIPFILRPRSQGRNNQQNSNSSVGNRRGSELDRYLEIFNYSSDLQNQLQGLSRRYRQLIDLSRRGGLIAPSAQGQPSTNNSRENANNVDSNFSEAETSRTSSDNSQTPTESTTSPRTTNPAVAIGMEARVLGSYIPRVMHHLSHLLHALSDFSVDFTSGQLILSVAPRNPHGQTARRPNVQLSEILVPAFGTREFARRSVPFVPNRAQTPTNATTRSAESRPGSMGTRFPAPSSFAATNPIDSTSHQQQQQQPIGNQSQQSTSSNSTQTTVNRPIGTISGRIPFDYFLPCLSPWALTAYNVSNRQSNGPEIINATIQIGTINPDDSVNRNVSTTTATTTTTEPQSNNSNAANQSESRTTNLVDSGLTEVVSNIVGSIFRSPSNPQQTVGDNTTTTNTQQQSQDPILNIIPELALNAVSQILGGVLGMPANQQQSNVNSNEQDQRNQQLSSNTIMMDIDIDESSNTLPEFRYQNVDDQGTSENISTQCSSLQSQQQTTLPQPGHSRQTTSTKIDSKQLPEVMKNHPEWIPIIEADINVMTQQQNSTNGNSQPYFSDAYLSSIPKKRRRLLTASPDRVLILHPSPSQAITSLLRRAITTSRSSDIESLDQILLSISSDSDLQSAYEEHIRSEVGSRLRRDYDYTPQKFQNSSRYFR